jgi:hypothetical protein
MLGQKKRTAFLQSFIGTTAMILTEGTVEGGFRSGFTDSFARVAVSAAAVGENELVRVSLAGVRDDRLEGRPVSSREEAA